MAIAAARLTTARLPARPRLEYVNRVAVVMRAEVTTGVAARISTTQCAARRNAALVLGKLPVPDDDDLAWCCSCATSRYCGTTTDHCRAPDCLFDFGPACDANKTPAGTNTSTLNRSPLGNIDVGGAGIYSCENDGDVALTFDDGPEGYTSDLLDILARYNAKATFFITGINNGKGEIDDNSLQWPSVIQ